MGRNSDEATIDAPRGDWSPEQLCIAVTTGGPFETVPLVVGGSQTVGRSSRCDVLIDDPSVSRQHAKVQWIDGRGLCIMDLGSSNGVVVGGVRIPAQTWTPVQVGEMVKIGSALLMVRPKRSSRPRGLWTHGYFASRLEEECARCSRAGTSFAVLRVGVPATSDIHAVEDAFAIWLRAADVLARYAPLEYEVLYVDTTVEQAGLATDRLLHELGSRARLARADVRIGLACFPRDARSADELLAFACDAASPEPRRDGEQLETPLVLANLGKVAASDMSVLLLGETGVGKEICAERIHAISPRAGGRLLRLNCAALSETLLESELFGHERGAFTGAARTKPGLLETATGGTVLLDEIGEMPLSTQAKLLRVLEERKIQRVGGLEPIAIDVRFIAATNRDLDAEVVAGRFRQDLLFRLNTFTFHIPPLRARVGEIESLARHFIQRASRANGQSPPALTAPALEMLRRYPWPGNIRELRNVVERAVVLAGADPIRPEHLPGDKMSATLLPGPVPARPADPDRDALAEWDQRKTLQFDAPPVVSTAPPRATAPAAGSLQDSVEEVERARIIQALEECVGNQSRAAKLLGISRGTLIKRLDRYGIPRPRKR